MIAGFCPSGQVMKNADDKAVPTNPTASQPHFLAAVRLLASSDKPQRKKIFPIQPNWKARNPRGPINRTYIPLTSGSPTVPIAGKSSDANQMPSRLIVRLNRSLCITDHSIE